MTEASKNVSLFGQAKCCGAEGPTDWAGSSWLKKQTPKSNNTVPWSCCPDKRKNCTVTGDGTYKEVMPHYHLKF